MRRPVAPGRCGAHGPGCGAAVDVYGDLYAACPRTGLLARRAKPLERAWIRVVREAVGPEGQVVPQQWLVRTPAPGVDPDDRRRLDFVAYGATQLGEALCCDVTLVSPPTRDGRPQPSSTTRDGARVPCEPLLRSESCHPGLVQTLVGPTQRGCAKHTCCHFARVAARPCPYARRAGAASAGRPARRVPARAQLPAGSLSRCSPPCSAVARRCTGTAR